VININTTNTFTINSFLTSSNEDCFAVYNKIVNCLSVKNLTFNEVLKRIKKQIEKTSPNLHRVMSLCTKTKCCNASLGTQNKRVRLGRILLTKTRIDFSTGLEKNKKLKKK